MTMSAVGGDPRELVREVTGLTSLPGVYFKVKELVDDPDSSLRDIGEVIGQDPALTMKLLRVANSAFYAFATEVATVSRAIARLGTQPVHDLVLAVSLAKAFAGISADVMDMERFWRSSVFCGMAAWNIAKRCNVLDGERLFVEGLLRDIGHLVLFDRRPRQAQQALLESQGSGVPIYQVERDLLGFDYAQLGAMLMREWRLPNSLCEPIHYHPEPAKAQGCRLEAAIIHIAGRMIDLVDTDTDLEEWLEGVDPQAWAIAGLDSEYAPSVTEEARNRTNETVELFFPSR